MDLLKFNRVSLEFSAIKQSLYQDISKRHYPQMSQIPALFEDNEQDL